MVKSILVDNDVHERFLDLQEIIKRKYGLKMSHGDIMNKLVDNPDKTAEELVKKIIA